MRRKAGGREGRKYPNKNPSGTKENSHHPLQADQNLASFESIAALKAKTIHSSNSVCA